MQCSYMCLCYDHLKVDNSEQLSLWFQKYIILAGIHCFNLIAPKGYLEYASQNASTGDATSQVVHFTTWPIHVE